MATYKTPDVYIEEISVFPPSVAEVETAIPAFIGYTEKAQKNLANDLIMKPTKIYSMTDYEDFFGGPKEFDIDVDVTTDSDGVLQVTSVDPTDPEYIMWYSMKMYFDNGGGQCYIVSVGTYQSTPVIDLEGDDGSDPTTATGLADGLRAVQEEDEPTLIVVPEAVKLQTTAEYQTLVQAILTQCKELQDRFGVFDIYHGGVAWADFDASVDRGFFGNNHLKYGASYYPFVKTTLNYFVDKNETNVKVDLDGAGPADLNTFENTNTAVYNLVKAKLKDHFVVLPPSPAVTGIYAATDKNRGVWKAPANVSLANVLEPVVKLDNARQDGLNVDPTSGKSINAIRSFMGKGTLVWGARTLAGNDNEWRYVPVRRFFNMVEESVKKSTYWAVFEPNDANTWVKVRGMIEAYLLQKWREGALAGATPREAFFVRCGLGTTMNAQDILEGRMNVEIGMAVVRPAEFIILKFSHKLQTS